MLHKFKCSVVPRKNDLFSSSINCVHITILKNVASRSIRGRQTSCLRAAFSPCELEFVTRAAGSHPVFSPLRSPHLSGLPDSCTQLLPLVPQPLSPWFGVQAIVHGTVWGLDSRHGRCTAAPWAPGARPPNPTSKGRRHPAPPGAPLCLEMPESQVGGGDMQGSVRAKAQC